jgi:hypothetical protein
VTVIETASVMMNTHVDSLIAREKFAEYFAPDVTLHLMGTDQEKLGVCSRAQITAWLLESGLGLAQSDVNAV